MYIGTHVASHTGCMPSYLKSFYWSTSADVVVMLVCLMHDTAQKKQVIAKHCLQTHCTRMWADMEWLPHAGHYWFLIWEMNEVWAYRECHSMAPSLIQDFHLIVFPTLMANESAKHNIIHRSIEARQKDCTCLMPTTIAAGTHKGWPESEPYICQCFKVMHSFGDMPLKTTGATSSQQRQ